MFGQFCLETWASLQWLVQVFYGNIYLDDCGNRDLSLSSEWEDGAIPGSCSALFEAPRQPSQGGVQETAVLHGCCSTSF